MAQTHKHKPRKRGAVKYAKSKTHKGDLDYTTKRGDKDFHEGGHNQKRKRRPYARKGRGGNSNAGKYDHEGLPTSDFAGPRGGSKAGTYPINTLARARAALRYAHFAPHPAGIRSAVCSKWGGRLKSCRK